MPMVKAAGPEAAILSTRLQHQHLHYHHVSIPPETNLSSSSHIGLAGPDATGVSTTQHERHMSLPPEILLSSSTHIDYLPSAPLSHVQGPSDHPPNSQAAGLRTHSSSTRIRDEIVEIPLSASSNVSRRHLQSPLGSGHDEQAYELDELFCEKERSPYRFHGPISIVTSIFNCWSHSKEKSGSLMHSFRSKVTRSRMTTLFEQNRLQQEALLETQDTRDVWEWMMEQQRVIACQQHDVLDRNYVEINPLHGALPDLLRNSNTTESTNIYNEGETNVVSLQSGKDSSSAEVCARLSNALQDPDIISAIMLLFESALVRCRLEVNFFCRVYMQQIVFSGYTLIRTLMEMEPTTVFVKKVHASYALESRINSALFRCFENDSFDDSGLTRIFDPSARALARLQDYLRMKSVDPVEALRLHTPAYNPAFHAFCANKSEEVMSMLSWNMGYRSAAERDRFMDAFLRAAKWVWLLHRLANAANLPMQILRVGRGQEVDPLFVEAVAVPPIASCKSCPVSAIPKVEFMVMPGFRADKKVFRCKVYQHYR